MQGSPRIDELRQKFHENPRRYFAPLANEYRKAGDPEQAIAICRAHLAQQPGHMSGHVVYAQSLYDAGRTDESRVVFEKALSLDPDNAIVLRYLGDISRQRGDSSEALHWYSRALEADPQDSHVAAYIAELTEPLTEPATSVKPAAEESEAPVASEADSVSAEPVAEAPAEKVEEPAPESHVEQETAPQVVAAADSPFVTRTMAELYASQGHREAALDVYHQLAAANPDDPEIANRIRELSPAARQTEEPGAAETEPTAETPPEPTAQASTEQPVEETSIGAGQIPTMAPVEFADFAPPDAETATEFTELTDFESDLTFDSQPEPEPTAEPEPGEPAEAHFTETEIGETHKWDEGGWGDDFSSGDMEIAPHDFSMSEPSIENEPATSETADESLAPAAATDESAADEPAADEPAADEPAADESGPEVAPSPSIEEPAAEEPAAEEPAAAEDQRAEAEASDEHGQRDAAVESGEALEIAGHGSTSVPLGVLNDAHEDIPDELAAATQLATVSDEVRPEEEHDEESLVAYSPQTPDEDHLAHYEPQGPTIREFFATLGARRPPANGDHESFTAHAAVPGVDAIDDLPLASDAFSSLFADSPVSEEDSKAAFALSGAMGAHAPAPETTTPRATPQSSAPAVQPPASAPAAATPAAQESEEDIRRFREWLDGLADA